MEFKATRKEFTCTDESGYRFDVVLVLDDEYGWGAGVSFNADGYKTEHGALSKLRESVERFLVMLREAKP